MCATSPVDIFYTLDCVIIRLQEDSMATNLALDDKLIDDAVRAGGHKTKKAAVTAALLEYVRSRRRQRILRLKGQVEYFDDYDYKALRRRA